MTRPECATPWIDRLRTLEAVRDRMLEWTFFPNPAVVWGDIQEFDRTIRALGDLLAESLPLPVPEETTDRQVDTAVERVVVALIEDADVPADATENARRAGRIERHDGAVTVPLSTVGDAVGNWFVVLRVVSERLDGIADGVERVAGRGELDGRTSSATAMTDVSDALRDTAATVRNLASQALWLHPPNGLIDAKYHRIREYAVRTAESYNPYA